MQSRVAIIEKLIRFSSGLYDKQYSDGHKFSIAIPDFVDTYKCDFEQANLATFDPQNGDFEAIW